MDCNDFCYFLDPFRGLFWDENVKKWDTEKRLKKGAENSTRGDPVNSVSCPCGPLKEIKNQRFSGTSPQGGPLKQYREKLPSFLIRNTPLVPCGHGGGY